MALSGQQLGRTASRQTGCSSSTSTQRARHPTAAAPYQRPRRPAPAPPRVASDRHSHSHQQHQSDQLGGPLQDPTWQQRLQFLAGPPAPGSDDDATSSSSTFSYSTYSSYEDAPVELGDAGEVSLEHEAARLAALVERLGAAGGVEGKVRASCWCCGICCRSGLGGLGLGLRGGADVHWGSMPVPLAALRCWVAAGGQLVVTYNVSGLHTQMCCYEFKLSCISPGSKIPMGLSAGPNHRECKLKLKLQMPLPQNAPPHPPPPQIAVLDAHPNLVQMRAARG